MALGYWREGRTEQEAAFHLYFRTAPFRGGYTIACGIEPALAYLEGLRFTDEDLGYLATLCGADDLPLFPREFLDVLGSVRLTLDLDMTLVFVGQSGATTRLYQRRLDASAVAVLPGTDGAYGPFFSPDGQSVGFFSGGTVKRTNLQTGATVSLAELVLPYGGVWLADGRILIAAQEGDQLVAVPSTGGAPAVIGSPEVTRRAVFPSPLPGGSTVLMSPRAPTQLFAFGFISLSAIACALNTRQS